MDTVLNWVWQGVVVAAALFLMLRALEGVRANVRYIVCSLALLIVLTIPVLWSLSSTSDESQYTVQSSVGPIVSVPAAPWASATAMLGLWFAWMGVQGFCVSKALIGLRRARRACRPFPTDVEERLRHWVDVGKEQRRACEPDTLWRATQSHRERAESGSIPAKRQTTPTRSRSE